jgi:plasmid segregation protein ParM
MAEIGKEQSLIIDPGSRDLRLAGRPGHAAGAEAEPLDQPRHVRRAAPDRAEITKDIGTPYRDYDAIDLALRTGKAPVIFQKPYDMKRLMPLAESVAEQAVSSMKEWIEAPHSLQNIILVGGGAFLFRKAVKAAFPRHRIHEVKEPMFANVRGFSWPG